MVVRLPPQLVLAITCACSGTEGPILWESEPSVMMDSSAPGPVDAGVLVLTLSGETSTTLHGNTEAEESLDVCPENQALIGYRGTIESDVFVGADSAVPVIGALEGVCATLSVAPSGKVTTSEAGLLPKRGMADDDPWERRCAENEVIVAFSGRSGSALDRLGLTCSAWSVSAASGTPKLARGPLHPLEQVGGTGGSEFNDGCPEGQLARGSHVRSGFWIDAWGLICGTPAVARE